MLVSNFQSNLLLRGICLQHQSTIVGIAVSYCFVLHFFLQVKLFTQHVVRGDYWVATNCSLTVNGGVASLIAWLDHSCQKTEVGGKQGHAPCRRILLQQIPMTMRVNPAISVKGTTPEKTESLLHSMANLLFQHLYYWMFFTPA